MHRGDQIRRRACAAGERQHDQTGDHRELGEGDDVLRPDPLPHAEHVHPGERGDGRHGDELGAVRREGQEVAPVACEGHGDGGDGGGLDDDEQRPPVEETPERAEGLPQVDAEPARLGKGGSQLRDGQGARQREERRHHPGGELQRRRRERPGDVGGGEEDGRADHHADVDQGGVEQPQRSAQAAHSSHSVTHVGLA